MTASPSPGDQPPAAIPSPVAGRPLLPVAVAFAVGIAAGAWPLWWCAAGLAAGAALLAGALYAWPRRPAAGLPQDGPPPDTHRARRAAIRTAAMLAALAVAGGLRFRATDGPAPDDVARFAAGRFVTVSAVVVSDVDARQWDYQCEVEASGITLPDGTATACSGRMLVRLRRDAASTPPDYGDGLDVHGILDRPTAERNEGDFDYGAWLARRGIYAAMSTRRPTDWRAVPSAGRSGLVGWVTVAGRRSLLDALGRLLPAREAELLGGILLGARSRMAPAAEDEFAATGTAHILATAGLHVGVVAVLLAGLCRLLWIPRRPAAAVQIVALALYAAMAGGRPSVVRAVLVADIVLLGWLLDRESDPVNSLAAAALLLLAFRPAYLFDVGFQLSFATIGAIFALLPLIRRVTDRLVPGPTDRGTASSRALHRSAGWAAGIVALSAAAQIGSAPLCAQHFHQVSLVGIAANALVVPMLFVLLPAGLLAWPLAAVWPAAAHVLVAVLLHPALAYVLWAVHMCARVPGAAIPTAPPGWALIALCYAVILLLPWWLRRMWRAAAAGMPDRRRYASAAACACAALLGGLLLVRPAPSGSFVVTFLDVGQGDAAVLRTPAGHTVVVDAGTARSEDDSGRRAVVPYLRAHGIGRIDALVLTHPDGDHAGGAATVVRQVGVGRLLMGEPAMRSDGCREVLSAAREAGVPVFTLARGQALQFDDGVVADVLNPPPGPPPAVEHLDNNESVVLRARYGGTSVLLMGDAEVDAERWVMRGPPGPAADVLKLGHHGSISASGAAFLDAVHPVVAIVSAGRRNMFGHPHPAVLARLEERQIRVFRTDRDGAITVVSDGRTLSISTAADGRTP